MLNCRWKEDPVDPVRIVCDLSLIHISVTIKIREMIPGTVDLEITAEVPEAAIRLKRNNIR